MGVLYKKCATFTHLLALENKENLAFYFLKRVNKWFFNLLFTENLLITEKRADSAPSNSKCVLLSNLLHWLCSTDHQRGDFSTDKEI